MNTPSALKSDKLTPKITLSFLDSYEGQPAWKIVTPAATYIYHTSGCGLASLIDPDGNDWISYRPSDGPRGEYRGVANIIHPDGGFHPGLTSGQTELLRHDPDAVVLESTAFDASWRCRWRFTPEKAILTLQKAAKNYWMLYEGTPSGSYDEDAAFMIDSSGQKFPCNAKKQWRLPDPRWICFGSAGCARMLMLHDKTERAADVTESFWSMEKAMTVFGFGRLLDSSSDRWCHLSEVPATLELCFVDGCDFDAAASRYAKL